LETVDRLKSAHPDFTFTTDIIVGFPGETDYDFAETLDVMNEVAFAKVHMFPYSDRERTRANLYPNKVPTDVIKQRKAALMQQAEAQSFRLREAYVGRRMWVLTESLDSQDPEWITGHTDNFLRVKLPAEGLEPNELVAVELIENQPDGLLGRVCSACQEKAS
ncbi:MAG: tRNA (N(6)-L-threonylcarbamoyladenosine(37)-C(2))-methylthiotransferase MtaB, partial [Chlamydiia bacterium]|nr:tRNA (N(6)-L-threonylcarbamoyladenosine(37)-C(2))-methylthiotransferase MtaB [Chlamydiia bacterium]